MKQKFIEWYSKQIAQALDEGVPLDDIDIKIICSEAASRQMAAWCVQPYDI